MSYKKKVLITVILLIVAIAGGFKLYKSKKSPKPREMQIVTVTKGDITRIVEETGIIKPQVGALVKVGTRATGTLLKLRYQVGDRVKKGDLIALVDDSQDRTNLDNARANLVFQLESLKQVETTYPSRITEQEAIVRNSEAQLVYSQAAYKRQEDIYQQGISSRDDFEQSRKSVDVTQASLDQQRATLARLKDDFTSQKSLAKTNIDQQRARVRNLEINLGYFKIHAPISGIVSQVATQEGETVVSGLSATSLITILDPTRLEVWVYVDETDIGKVKEGMPVEFTIDSMRGRKFSGRVATISPQPEVKENIVYYIAKVYIGSDDASYLKPEMTTHVKIMSETRKSVLLVPNRGVRFEKGKNVVQRPGSDPKKPLSVQVQTGIRDNRNTEIVSGLNENDTILVEGSDEPAGRDGSEKTGAGRKGAAPMMPPAGQSPPR